MYFREIVTLLAVETNRYNHWCMGSLDDHHMGYVDKGDRMANSYSISCRAWKWMNKLFFHLFDLAILNSYILLSICCGKKISQRDF